MSLCVGIRTRSKPHEFEVGTTGCVGCMVVPGELICWCVQTLLQGQCVALLLQLIRTGPGVAKVVDWVMRMLADSYPHIDAGPERVPCMHIDAVFVAYNVRQANDWTCWHCVANPYDANAGTVRRHTVSPGFHSVATVGPIALGRRGARPPRPRRRRLGRCGACRGRVRSRGGFLLRCLTTLAPATGPAVVRAPFRPECGGGVQADGARYARSDGTHETVEGATVANSTNWFSFCTLASSRKVVALDIRHQRAQSKRNCEYNSGFDGSHTPVHSNRSTDDATKWGRAAPLHTHQFWSSEISMSTDRLPGMMSLSRKNRSSVSSTMPTP